MGIDVQIPDSLCDRLLVLWLHLARGELRKDEAARQLENLAKELRARLSSAAARKQRQRRRERHGHAIFRFDLDHDAVARFLVDRASLDPNRADDHAVVQAEAKRFWLTMIAAHEEATGVTTVTTPIPDLE